MECPGAVVVENRPHFKLFKHDTIVWDSDLLAALRVSVGSRWKRIDHIGAGRCNAYGF